MLVGTFLLLDRHDTPDKYAAATGKVIAKYGVGTVDGSRYRTVTDSIPLVRFLVWSRPLLGYIHACLRRQQRCPRPWVPCTYGRPSIFCGNQLGLPKLPPRPEWLAGRRTPDQCRQRRISQARGRGLFDLDDQGWREDERTCLNDH